MPMFLGSKYLDKRNYIANMSFQVPSQFATLQEAINHLYNKIIGPDVEIVIERGTVLSENITIDHRLKGNVTIRASVTYQWEGVLYMVGAKPPIVNAPPDITVDSDVGVGTVSLSNSGNDLVVTCSTTNPTFSSNLVGNKVLIRDNSGTYHEFEITAVSGNVLTLDGTCPDLGDFGTTFVIAPKTLILGNSETGPSVAIENNLNRIQFRGLTVRSGLQAEAGAAIGLQLINCQVQMWNMLMTNVLRGIYADTNVLIRRSLGVCVWNPTNSDGISVFHASKIFGLFGLVGAISSGACVRLQHKCHGKFTYATIGSIFAWSNASGAVVEVASNADLDNCQAFANALHGFQIDEHSKASCNNAKSKGNADTGLYAYFNSRVQAVSIALEDNDKGVQCDPTSSFFLQNATFSGNTTADSIPAVRQIAGTKLIDSRCFHPRTLLNDVTEFGNATGTSETELFAYTLPANTLQYNGDCVEAEITFKHAANNNTKRFFLAFGGSDFFSTPELAINNKLSSVRFVITRLEQHAQLISVFGYEDTTLVLEGLAYEASKDLTQDQVIQIRGAAPTSGAADDIKKKSVRITFTPSV